MTIIDKIKKRIKTLEACKKEKIEEVQITREEAEQISGKIREIDGVKLVLVDKLGDITKKDCFAYNNNKCSALRCLYCENGECRFYRNDITKEQIEQEVASYYKYDLSRR